VLCGPDDTLILMRNHEIDHNWAEAGYASAPQSLSIAKSSAASRAGARGKIARAHSSNRVLAGTAHNCAGGSSPWGWLSCEENVEMGHGYVFRCRTDAARVAHPERLPGYGRFRHEAVCIDPKTLTAYLTEDQTDGCFYRYRPSDLRAPHTSGQVAGFGVFPAPSASTPRAASSTVSA